MKKSKVFLIIAIIFMLIVFYVVYDMSTRTRFPGGKPSKKGEYNNSDKDSVKQVDPMEVEIRR
ncbi:hypothetical protein QYS48_19105 [Marivirga arenosa]|uniref:Uncharacterized protein n=1 Tax=Marivirga arenosa TaxID=3059076 RepID=A0AA49GDH7_9BACT|nr:hypothetical protein [Marivirga sp. ABR2-2]WKK84276.2 hypothetical protein QYS48_19105 [Marivirga sp. ABR2-2]